MDINYDMIYLIMVGVFLIASVLLMLWNRGREKDEPGHIHVSGTSTAEESHLQAQPPEIQRPGPIEAAEGDRVQVRMWYYSIDGLSKHGPVTEEELRRLLGSRRLLPDTLVWTQGLPYWREASSFEIF